MLGYSIHKLKPTGTGAFLKCKQVTRMRKRLAIGLIGLSSLRTHTLRHSPDVLVCLLSLPIPPEGLKTAGVNVAISTCSTQVLQVEMATFTPAVFSPSGGIGTRVTRMKRSRDTSQEYCRWRREPLPQQYLVHPGVWGKRLKGCSVGWQNV